MKLYQIFSPLLIGLGAIDFITAIAVLKVAIETRSVERFLVVIFVLGVGIFLIWSGFDLKKRHTEMKENGN